MYKEEMVARWLYTEIMKILPEDVMFDHGAEMIKITSKAIEMEKKLTQDAYQEGLSKKQDD